MADASKKDFKCIFCYIWIAEYIFLYADTSIYRLLSSFSSEMVYPSNKYASSVS